MTRGAELLKIAQRRSSVGLELVHVGSTTEELLLLHIKADKLPLPVREYVFHPTRKWRFDFAWPAIKFAIEVQGGCHVVRARFHQDIRKRAAALLEGWSVLEVDAEAVRSGDAITWAKALLWERT